MGSNQRSPSTSSKWRSKEISSAPVSIAWAAIQMSLVGIGLPLARSSLQIDAKLVGDAGSGPA